MARDTYLRSLGSLLQLGCFVLLLGLIPYSLFAGFHLYVAFSSWTGRSTDFVAYPLARVIACAILIYALWELRKIGLRLRRGIP
ncbi:MAG TPA: hypothetical protein VF523_07215 [Burkholderiales bacterium]